MVSFASELERIGFMLEANGYGIRNGIMPLDDFRIFLTPPGFEVESEEVFKLKGSDNVHCAAQIIMGGEIHKAYFKQNEQTRTEFQDLLKSSTGVKDLDFFEIEDDGRDFVISIRTEFQIGELSEDVFADAMDRLNLAGGSIEDTINAFFDKLIHL